MPAPANDCACTGPPSVERAAFAEAPDEASCGAASQEHGSYELVIGERDHVIATINASVCSVRGTRTHVGIDRERSIENRHR